jgi:hypothetical protein
VGPVSGGGGGVKIWKARPVERLSHAGVRLNEAKFSPLLSVALHLWYGSL